MIDPNDLAQLAAVVEKLPDGPWSSTRDLNVLEISNNNLEHGGPVVAVIAMDPADRSPDTRRFLADYFAESAVLSPPDQAYAVSDFVCLARTLVPLLLAERSCLIALLREVQIAQLHSSGELDPDTIRRIAAALR
jgi:hypothetical protein